MLQQDEMVMFCKQYVMLLRSSPDVALCSKSDIQMWRVVVLRESIPVDQWWSDHEFAVLGANGTSVKVYGFIRDNQHLFYVVPGAQQIVSEVKRRAAKFIPPWMKWYLCPYCKMPEYMHYESVKGDAKCLIKVKWRIEPSKQNGYQGT